MKTFEYYHSGARQGKRIKQIVHPSKAEFFKTLSHPAYLAILDHLRDDEKRVNVLQALFGADQSTISQQLPRLRSGNWVDTRTDGTTVYYSVSEKGDMHAPD